MKNNRTFLEKLLDGAEVEWKPLWSITTWDKKFNAVEKEKQPKVIKYHYYLASELKPLIVDGGDVKLLTTNESDIWTTEELVKNNISEGEIIAIPWGGNPIVQYYKGKFVTADNRIATSNNTKILDNKFLYYFLLSKLDVISSFYRGSGIKHPSMYHVLEMLIPIPPLSVQTEIVKILDALTALTSELTSELTLRRKQYEYYREKLLSEEELGKVGFEWKSLSEVANIANNARKPVKSSLRISGSTPYYGANNIQDYVEGYTHDGEFVLIAEDGSASLENYSIQWAVGKFWANNHVHVVNGKEELNNRFLYHYLANMNFVPFLAGKERAKLTKAKLQQIPIFIPPLEEQHRIVSILDKFETLTNSITEGLPLAIEQSQKRYEYYRELLLDFS